MCKSCPKLSQRCPKVLILCPKTVSKLSQNCLKNVSKWSQNGPKFSPKLSQSSFKVVLKSQLSQFCLKNVPKLSSGISQMAPRVVPLVLKWCRRVSIWVTISQQMNWASAFHLAEVAGIVLARSCYWRPVWSVKLGRVDQLQVGIAKRAPESWK